MRNRLILVVVLLSAALIALLTAIGSATPAESRTIDLETLNGSGVVGTVTLTDLGRRRTRIEIHVDPAGNLDMPAHVHPGTCDTLVPQPRYPLRNVVDGSSTTDVPASLSELMSGDQAINLHHSNDDMRTYTACADLR
jgi:hypothetical protein